jgi:hypothetical protein
MVRTSHQGKLALPDALITTPSPEKGLCIDDESNCFDACLNDSMMCEKCKDLIGVNIHAGQSWAALCEKMAAMKSKNHKCQNLWQRVKYIVFEEAQIISEMATPDGSRLLRGTWHHCQVEQGRQCCCQNCHYR